MRATAFEDSRALFGAEDDVLGSDEVERSFEAVAVDHDLDLVTIANLAERSTGEGLWADVADAGACGDAGETGVGEDGDLFAEREVA